VQDVRGAFALQGFTIQVLSPATVPNVVGQTQATAQSNITSANFAVGTVSSQNSPTVPAGNVISQNPAGGTLAAPGSPVSIVVSIGPPPPGTVPNVVGETQTNAQADIKASGFTVGAVTGQNSTTAAIDIVLSQNPLAGTIAAAGSPVSLVVSLGPARGDLDLDGDGFTPNRGDCNDFNAAIHPGAFDIAGDGIDQNCNGVDSVAGDNIPPTGAFGSPAEDAVITVPTDIVGTADDANFLRYELQVARVNDNQFTVIGSGTASVINGVLGRLDPTLLEDGIYRLRLIVEDVNGNFSVDERAYSVRSANTAHTRLAFVDLTIPLAGVPITVVRTYDSRIKTQGDFGVGWTLQLRQGSYEHNRDPGQGWRILPSSGPLPLPCRTTTETAFHVTQIWLSDREFYAFKLKLVNPAVLIGGCVAEARFDSFDGSTGGAKLEILGNTQVIYTSGDEVRDFGGDEDNGVIYNPQRVRLTTKDGRVIDLDRTDGIVRIQDRNGNSLDITPGGIVHSSGKSVSFTRDAQGRITRVTDPLNHALSYAYDSNGDLVAVTSRTGDAITHTYDGSHNLQAIQNSLGDFLFRAEYDGAGRLAATRDADGESVGIVYDFNNFQNTVTDRLGHSSVYKYDERGNITAETDALGRITTMTHGAFDTLLSTMDDLGNVTTSTYDAAGNLLTTKNPLGHVTSFTYNSAGDVLTVTDALGHTTLNTYDSRSNLLSTTDPMGNIWRNEYDAQGNVTRRTDPAGNSSTFDYNSFGWLSREVNVCGLETRYEHDVLGQRIRMIAARSLPTGGIEQIITQYEYDAGGRLIRTIYDDGFSTKREYDAAGNLGASVDKLGRRTTYSYTPRGQLSQTTYPDGTSQSHTYDAQGRLLTSVNRNGNVTTNVYDAIGQKVQTIHPDGAIEATGYDQIGQVITETDPLGHATIYEYDAASRRTSMTDALGRKTTYIYDPAGRLSSIQHPNAQVYSYEYDANHRQTKTLYPDGTFELMAYDFAGRLISKTDQAGLVTGFGYNGCGDLAEVIDASNQTTSYSYDNMRNRISQTDANGRVTQWEYDAFRRMTRRKLPLGMTETFNYNPVGALVGHTDFNGKTTTYSYDANDRLLTKTFPDSSSVAFTYTAGGQRSTMVDARGVTHYVYDAADRLTEVIQPDGTSISYTYDAADNRKSLTVPSGTTGFSYDPLNRLASVTEPGGGITNYSYDVVGNLLSTSYPSGNKAERSYDTLNRLVKIENKRADNTIMSSFSYGLGAAGNRLQVSEQGGRSVTYDYDSLYRLTGENVGDPLHGNRTITYSYDAAGNRLTKNDSSTGTTTYAYDFNDRLISENGQPHTYDANGNVLTQPNGTSYQYDFENRLIRAATPAATVNYAYDADGVRVQSRTNGVTTNYLVDNNRRYSQVIEEKNGSGTLLASNVFGRDLIRRQQGAIGTYYHYDGQRSVRQLTDASGAVTDDYIYDGFGSLEDHSGASNNPYLYTGEEFDSRLGQYYLRARYYQPGLGRFLTIDPAAGIPSEPRTLNRYAYAWNDPVNQQDPSGEQSSLAEAMISVAINGILAQLPEQGVAVEIPVLHIDFSDVESWQDVNNPPRYTNTSAILSGAFQTTRGNFSAYNVKVLRWGEAAIKAGLVKPKLMDKLIRVEIWDDDTCPDSAWGCAPLNGKSGVAFLQTLMSNVALSDLPKKSRGDPNGAAGILLGQTISHEAGHLYGICHPGKGGCTTPPVAQGGIMWTNTVSGRLGAGWDGPSKKQLEKVLGLKQ
jgi:RHS repeat-associated protein